VTDLDQHMSVYKDAITNLCALIHESGEAAFSHCSTVDQHVWREESKRRRELLYLKRQKLITLREEGDKIIYLLTQKGYIRALKESIIAQQQQLPEGEANLVIFDIPEPMSKVRATLRRLLKKAGFTLLQRSVWHGSMDVIDDFRLLVKALQAEKYIYIYRVLDEYR